MTGNSAAVAGGVIGGLVIAAAGLLLLIFGLRSRSKARSVFPPYYPPGYSPASPGVFAPGYPPAYPPSYPPGVPGYPGADHPPMAQPPRRGGTGLIISGIVVLAVSGMVFVGTLAAFAARSTRLAVGDCFTNEMVNHRTWTSTSCSEPDAVLEYAGTVDSRSNCPDGKLVKSSYLSVEHDGARRCFLPNLIEDHCYRSENDDETVRAVSCGTTGKVVRVIRRVDGRIDTSACSADSHAATFPQPERTYCVQRTDGTI